VISSRQNGYLRLIVNGILREANTNSTNINGTSNTSFGTNSQLGGDLTELYMSNFRMCIGSVPTLYSTTSTTAGTAIFTVPNSPLTLTSQGASNVQLLAFGDNRFIDRSTNNFAITAVSTPPITRFSPFANQGYNAGVIGGSTYFNGSTDYLSISASTPLDMSTGDFTIECWLYIVSTANLYPTFLGGGATWVAGSSGHRYNNTGYANKFTFHLNGSAGVATGDPFLASSGTFSFNNWYHYALTRSGNTWNMYVNGVLQNTQTYAGSFNPAINGMRVGDSAWDGANGFFNGYVSDLRIVKGTALYTANFNTALPPAPIRPVTNTVLLLNMTNAAVTDASMQTNVSTVGDARSLTTKIKKYNSSMMYFDGTGDWLTIPAGQVGAFGIGDFTIECWFYATTVATANQAIVAQRTGDTAATVGWALSLAASVLTANASNGTTSYAINHQTSILANTWYHAAMVRSGTSITVYLNGVPGTSPQTVVSSFSINGSGTTIYVAYASSGSVISPLNGYIDDLRVTKGVARYYTNFTPPGGPSRLR
jgi:hypothetical protein